MSNYVRTTKHPYTGIYENASWFDNYFGPRLYGVQFPSEPKHVFPADNYLWEFEDEQPPKTI